MYLSMRVSVPSAFLQFFWKQRSCMHLTFAAVVMSTDVPVKVFVAEVQVQNEKCGLKSSLKCLN